VNIGAQVKSEGRVKVVELAAAFDLSEMTIRRDLDILAERVCLLAAELDSDDERLDPYRERWELR
jgi:DeoR/GlpR family transcriptional regulator of sugar metabolism